MGIARVSFSGRRRWLGAMLVFGLGALALPAAALGATRYASPTGTGPSGAGGCVQADPCSLDNAVEDPSVANGDEVIVLPGTYTNLSGDSIIVDNAIDLHGAAGGPRPVIMENSVSTTLFVFVFSGTAMTVRDLEIQNAANNGAALASLGAVPTTVEHVVASSAATNSYACNPSNTVIRDSICRNTSTGPAAGVSTGSTDTATFRNTTLISGGDAVHVEAGGSGVNVTWDLKNVIARGGTNDVFASQTTGATVTVNLANSNYLNESASGGATITPSTAPTNQEAAPVFVDAPSGDFHQAASSPTIDAGDPGASMLGTFDLDADPRTLDGNCDGTAQPDIGADEFSVNCPVPPQPEPEPQAGDTTPPNTTITKGPKDKTKKKTATFEFSSSEAGSTFECKLDNGPFQPCTSPHDVKVKKGKHTFEVRAKDAAGNVDGSPATDSWKVKKKKK